MLENRQIPAQGHFAISGRQVDDCSDAVAVTGMFVGTLSASDRSTTIFCSLSGKWRQSVDLRRADLSQKFV